MLKKKATEVEKKSGGWFSGFWGRRESKKKEDEESFVPESKCRLYYSNFLNRLVIFYILDWIKTKKQVTVYLVSYCTKVSMR